MFGGCWICGVVFVSLCLCFFSFSLLLAFLPLGFYLLGPARGWKLRQVRTVGSSNSLCFCFLQHSGGSTREVYATLRYVCVCVCVCPVKSVEQSNRNKTQ